MIIEVAKAGRGSHSLVKDNSLELNAKVIKALSNASDLSLKGCQLSFGKSNETLGEVFRH